jgi:TonB family protein
MYTAPGTDVLCKWVVLLNEAPEESLILDTNEDAARYLINKPSKKPPFPKILSVEKPVYPDAAKAEHIQGTVKMLVNIDPMGHVGQIDLISGPRILSRYAVKAVQEWIYEPVMVDSTAIAVRVLVSVNYRMGTPY